MKVSSTFSKVAGWRGGALPRPSQWAKSSRFPKAQEGRSNNPVDCLTVGNPSEGFPILPPLCNLLKGIAFFDSLKGARLGPLQGRTVNSGNPDYPFFKIKMAFSMVLVGLLGDAIFYPCLTVSLCHRPPYHPVGDLLKNVLAYSALAIYF